MIRALILSSSVAPLRRGGQHRPFFIIFVHRDALLKNEARFLYIFEVHPKKSPVSGWRRHFIQGFTEDSQFLFFVPMKVGLRLTFVGDKNRCTKTKIRDPCVEIDRYTTAAKVNN